MLPPSQCIATLARSLPAIGCGPPAAAAAAAAAPADSGTPNVFPELYSSGMMCLQCESMSPQQVAQWLGGIAQLVHSSKGMGRSRADKLVGLLAKALAAYTSLVGGKNARGARGSKDVAAWRLQDIAALFVALEALRIDTKGGRAA